MKYLPSTLLIAALLSGGAMSLSAASHAVESQNAVSTEASVQAQSFVKKRYSIKGEWSIQTIDGKAQIVFSDNFKTKGGPDLKVFLSKKPISELQSDTVSQQSTLLAVLKSNKGSQSYILPDNLSLNDYESVVIHCEAFSVLWGGFDIPRAP